MKAYIVFAHEGHTSFCHEILNRTKQLLEREGISYNVRDLYQHHFQPVFRGEDMHRVEVGDVSADIAEEQQQITDADLLVMIFPIWWWSPPAIMKGYLDRVFTNGFAFRYGEKGPEGLLHGKRALVMTTTRESEHDMRASGLDHVVEKQMADGTLSMMGYQVVYHNFAAVPYVSERARKGMLNDIENDLQKILQPAGV
ncbi:NAD(P)H-dependent oxidoreductase [Brevibacillus ruminantium]|uniref:NAD(P)H-dependent oxidoreductase n=1 Tax=Brevibacillus ruminantium TaxID=2950604 RepID=A0ABY4W9W3_9BACL|nr:NAD(P)H-dependent oxidoreductase [Brevibacillus ruminantium]USG63817.1 NAD(P)H-dependent oxidoreductase [Brevibacillus ruminantium]